GRGTWSVRWSRPDGTGRPRGAPGRPARERSAGGLTRRHLGRRDHARTHRRVLTASPVALSPAGCGSRCPRGRRGDGRRRGPRRAARAGPAPARRAPGRSHPPVPGPRRCRRGSASCRALAASARAVLDLALRRLIASKQKSAMVDGNLIAGYALGNDATVLATDHDFAHIAAVTALQHEYVQPSLD